jgi:hypothetical protein
MTAFFSKLLANLLPVILAWIAGIISSAKKVINLTGRQSDREKAAAEIERISAEMREKIKSGQGVTDEDKQNLREAIRNLNNLDIFK